MAWLRRVVAMKTSGGGWCHGCRVCLELAELVLRAYVLMLVCCWLMVETDAKHCHLGIGLVISMRIVVQRGDLPSRGLWLWVRA